MTAPPWMGVSRGGRGPTPPLGLDRGGCLESPRVSSAARLLRAANRTTPGSEPARDRAGRGGGPPAALSVGAAAKARPARRFRPPTPGPGRVHPAARRDLTAASRAGVEGRRDRDPRRARPARTCRPRAARPWPRTLRRPLTARASRELTAAGHRGRAGACAPRATCKVTAPGCAAAAARGHRKCRRRAPPRRCPRGHFRSRGVQRGLGSCVGRTRPSREGALGPGSARSCARDPRPPGTAATLPALPGPYLRDPRPPWPWRRPRVQAGPPLPRTHAASS